MLDRTQAPSFRPVVSYTLPKPEVRHLRNEQKLYIWETHTQPVVALQGLFRAGKQYEARPGIADFMAKMLREGTQKQDHQEIANTVARHGAHLQFRTSGYFLEVELFCLPRFLPSMLGLLHELLYQSTFPQARLDQLLRLQADQLLVNQQKNSFVATEQFRKHLFGADHPLGRLIEPEVLLSIESQELQDFFNQYVRQRPAEWFLTGAFSEEVPELIDQYFGQESLRDAPKLPQHTPAPSYKQVYVEKEQAVQTSLRLGRFTLPAHAPDFPAMQVMNEIFGGYFGSRLMQNLREERGLTYGVFSHLQVRRESEALWMVGADVRKENRQEARDEIFNELAAMQKLQVSQEELERVLNYLSGAFVSDLSTPFAVTDKFMNLRRMELPDTYYDQLIPTWRSLTREQVQEAAQKYGAGQWLEVMVG